jgi:4-hydroxyphenylpyruvate dioxygenase
MIRSIATVSLSGSLDTKLWAIADAGFDGVEICESDLLTYPDSARVVGGIMRDNGLTCTAFQPLSDFEGLPASLRKRAFDRAEHKFDVMAELDAGLLIVTSNVSPDSLPDRARIADDFRELAERAAARGLRIAYEALAWGRHIWDHREAWAIVQAVNHPAFGLALDSFSSLAREVPIESLRAVDPKKLFVVQIADAPLLHMDPLAWSRHFRCMPSQGDFPLVSYVKALVEVGYEGVLSLETSNDRFHAGSTAGIAVDGMRSLIFLQEQVARELQPDRSTQFPERVQCRGVDFIEFCASDEDAKPLGQLLHSLGFHPAGKHRTKAVTRWVQGTINLVINCETEGFAGTFDKVHGTSVCAIGLEVADPLSALERARQLLISAFYQPVSPDEYNIPAVRGVGGSLLYFISPHLAANIWQTEFAPLPAAAPESGAGLERVDHFTQATPYEEMLSWQLLYVSLFDVSRTAEVEIDDPAGVLLSQAVQSDDGLLRVVLNGSAATRTLAARFLTNYVGAGVQHIAFATSDIFATASKVRALGMEFLPIPENYYDDLAARFGLEEALVERMAEFNILYDRDAHGEYFQLFSRAFAKRFFFEIVERRGYSAYGAANSAIRLAAQSRYRGDKPTPLPGKRTTSA